MHIQRALAILTLFAEHGLLKVDVGARVVLATHDDDFLVLASGDFDVDVRPLDRFAAAPEDFLQLGDGQRIDRIRGVDEHGQGIIAHNVFHRILTALFRKGKLFALHPAARIGDIYGPIDESSDPGAGTPAGHSHRNVGIDALIGLCPSLRDVD